MSAGGAREEEGGGGMVALEPEATAVGFLASSLDRERRSRREENKPLRLVSRDLGGSSAGVGAGEGISGSSMKDETGGSAGSAELGEAIGEVEGMKLKCRPLLCSYEPGASPWSKQRGIGEQYLFVSRTSLRILVSFATPRTSSGSTDAEERVVLHVVQILVDVRKLSKMSMSIPTIRL